MIKVFYASNSSIPSLTANSMHVMKMCQAFAELGTEVNLAAIRGGEAQDFALREQYGVGLDFCYHLFRPIPILQQYDFALWAAWKAWLLKPDLVVTRHLPVAYFTSLLGFRVALEMHGPRLGKIKTWLFRSILGKKNLRAFITISKPLVEEFLLLAGVRSEELKLKLLTLSDAVDLERFAGLPAPQDARRVLGLDPNGFWLGYTGHLYEGRGIDIIIGLARIYKECRFLVVGGEPDHVAKWQRFAAAQGIENVIFTGFVNNKSLPTYMAASDALLMPYQHKVAVSGGGDTSKWMSPLKMFEYMASGRPVIASDLPVLHEVLSELHVIFCEPASLESWGQGVSTLMSDRELGQRLVDRCQADVKNYTWKGRASKILEIATGNA